MSSAARKSDCFFNKLVRSERGEPQIRGSGLPASIVATDLVSGNKVVFQKGSLSKAMRASMSVPGLMSPVEDGEAPVWSTVVWSITCLSTRCASPVIPMW